MAKTTFKCKGEHLYNFGVRMLGNDKLAPSVLYTVERNKRTNRYEIYTDTPERDYYGSFSQSEYQQFESFVRSYRSEQWQK